MTDAQKEQIAAWVEAGATPADVQKRLADDLGVNMTYLEVRMLIGDLGVTPPAPEPEEKEEDAPVPESAPEPAGLGADLGLGSKVAVTFDKITRPGAVASGTATFSDGEKAKWQFDQLGRLALDPDTPGYRPSQQDVAAFQRELQEAARRGGI